MYWCFDQLRQKHILNLCKFLALPAWKLGNSCYFAFWLLWTRGREVSKKFTKEGLGLLRPWVCFATGSQKVQRYLIFLRVLLAPLEFPYLLCEFTYSRILNSTGTIFSIYELDLLLDHLCHSRGHAFPEASWGSRSLHVGKGQAGPLPLIVNSASDCGRNWNYSFNCLCI